MSHTSDSSQLQPLGPAAVAPHDRPLPVAGFKGTPEDIEQQWYSEVYLGRGDSMAQLTWRAVLMGSCLGSVLSLTNLYIGLKAGWGFGVGITACILSYAIWTSLLRIGLARTPMTILENNCMQSTASSAGYSTGGTLVSAFAAYVIVNSQAMSVPLMLAWVFFIAVLGVTMAIPMKRQMINIEQLRFPSGVAAAETLRALHATSSRGMRAAKALGWAGLIAAFDKVWAEGLSARLEYLSSNALLTSLQKWLLGSHYAAWSGRTVIFSWDLIFLAAGAITGMRVCATIFVSGTLCWAVIVPILQAQGVITGTGFSSLVQWTLWFGASCMVAGGLLSLALSWRTALRAFGDLTRMFTLPSAAGMQRSGREDIEAPMSWFVMGQLVSLAALGWLGHVSFGMPFWQSIVAVALSFLLALVACRVTGETDTTPVGAMGKVTQLTFGALNPGNININLMSANITAGAATSAADLLGDLKSGYLLGAHPRQQFLAQFAGIFVGTLVTVLTFAALVPNPQVLGTDQFPAPAAQTWSAVAIALGQGLSALDPAKIWLILAGSLVGALLTLAPVLLPQYRDYLPSAAAFGLAWVFHWYYGLLLFLGALIASVLNRQRPAVAEEFTIPVASGLVAGGSLMGILLVLWANGGRIFGQLLGG